MKVKVLAFGVAKDILGDSVAELDIKGDTTADLKNMLEATYPRLKQLASYMVAVNNEYAEDDSQLTERDEIAIIPPVSGG